MTTSTTVHSHNTSVRDNPAYQAYLLLRVGFVVALILFGLDKVTNLLTDWTAYLAPAIDRLVPGSATGAMLAVGVVEIAAGLVVAVRPKATWSPPGWPGSSPTCCCSATTTTWPCATSGCCWPPWPWPGSPPPSPPPGPPRPRTERVHGCPTPDRRTRPARPPSPPPGRRHVPHDRPGPGRAGRDRAAGRPRPGPGRRAARRHPRRVAASYAELLTPAPFTLTTFPNHDGYDQLVLARAIPHLPLPAPSPALHRPGPHRLPPGWTDPGPVQAGPGGRAVHPPPPGPRTAHHPDRRLAPDPPGTQGRRGGAGGRAPMHVAPRRARGRRPHRHLGPPRPAAHDPRSRQEFLALTRTAT